MQSSLKEHYPRHREHAGENSWLNLLHVLVDSIHIALNTVSSDLSLSERISRYGKIRLLVICDENLGRSPLFSIALKKHVAEFELENMVEVLSAGTDVTKKGSQNKYSGGAHPDVKAVMGHISNIDPNEHRVTQFDETLVTPNTILVILNDPKKISKKIKKNCFAALDFSMDDPHDAGEDPLSLYQRLLILYEKECFLALYLSSLLKQAIKSNDLIVFQVCESIFKS